MSKSAILQWIVVGLAVAAFAGFDSVNLQVRNFTLFVLLLFLLSLLMIISIVALEKKK